jgi:hypothetical protein
MIAKYILMVLVLLVLINTSCKKERSCEGCNENNKPPIAIAGPDQVITLPTDSVSLDGSSSSDPDGTISEWLWTKITGPASSTIVSVTKEKTVVNNLDTGIYRFELKVTDNAGLFAKDTIQITVIDPSQPNRPPIANAGTDQTIILPTNTVTLDASGSTDPENNIASYFWTKISGPFSFNILNANGAQTSVTDLAVGSYVFEITVTDTQGLLSKDRVNVFVDTTTSGIQAAWEVIITLPIDSVFIDDYYRDTEGTCVGFISGPGNYTIKGAWVKNLAPGVYFFRRYWINCTTPAEIIKVTVLDDPNEHNTIIYKNLIWEYNCAWTPNNTNCPHLFLSRPMWPGLNNYPIEVQFQMDSLNNGQWFSVPSNTDGYNFWLNCEFTLNNCLYNFIVKVSPEISSWDSKKANLKIKIY